jgi:hypothetical protein
MSLFIPVKVGGGGFNKETVFDANLTSGALSKAT